MVEVLLGKYEVGRVLGCGAFAKVYYGRNIEDGQSVAIKVINKKKVSSSTSLMSNIKREITIMRRLHHPSIVRLYEVLASKSKIYFILELVKGGELFAKVAKGRFSEDLARNYFSQLLSAISYCHSRGVYHRDLKPENLLLDENGNLKVSDFGLSALKPNDNKDYLLQTLCGTPAYVAPEILAKKGYDGAKVDIWSCGIILYVLTAGYLPFNDPNLMAMYKKIYKGEFRCPKWMSSDLKRFLSHLLDTNPATRFSLDQIIRDPWFTKAKDQHSAFHFTPLESTTTNTSFTTSTSITTGTSSSTGLSCSLNAFDLISFSSGLDLSGLFHDPFNPIVHSERFLSAEPASKILDQIETAASSQNATLKRNKDSDAVDLEGPKSHFVATLEITPLTDHLLVVEAKTKAGDSASFTLFWANNIRPHLSGLLYHPDSQPPPLTTTPPAAADAAILL